MSAFNEFSGDIPTVTGGGNVCGDQRINRTVVTVGFKLPSLSVAKKRGVRRDKNIESNHRVKHREGIESLHQCVPDFQW